MYQPFIMNALTLTQTIRLLIYKYNFQDMAHGANQAALHVKYLTSSCYHVSPDVFPSLLLISCLVICEQQLSMHQINCPSVVMAQ